MAFVRRKDGDVVEITAVEQSNNRDGGEWTEESGTVSELSKVYFPDVAPA